MQEDDWMKIEMEKRGQTEASEQTIADPDDDEETVENEPMDEEERITAIIYSDPELRELYATDRDAAITQARISMYENAETEFIPLTSKPNDGGFPRR